MEKDAYYFSHDANARNDQKMLAVRMKHGLLGYAIFFCLIEILRESKGYKIKPDWEALAYDLRTDAQAVVDVASNYGLFMFDGDFMYSESLLKRMKELDEKRERKSQAGRIGGLASANKRSTTVQRPSSIKVNESKVLKRYTPTHQTTEEFINSLKTNSAYTHINLGAELAKMDAWLLTRPGRKKTKRFVLNWLNKIEPPLEPVKNGPRTLSF